MTPIPATPTRRIVRRAVIALVVVVLLLVWYVGSVATMGFVVNAGFVWVPPAATPFINAYTAPLVCYMQSGLPGSKACQRVVRWCEEQGTSLQARQSIVHDSYDPAPQRPPEATRVRNSASIALRTRQRIL